MPRLSSRSQHALRYRQPYAVARAYTPQVDEALYRGVLIGGALALAGFWIPLAAWLLRG